MSLRSFLGLLEFLLGGLKSEKMMNVPREKHFFGNVFFSVLELLILSWVLLFPFFGGCVPKLGPKKGSKSCPNCDKKKGRENELKMIKNV